MPTPRMTTTFATQGTFAKGETFAKAGSEFGGSQRAIVMSTVGGQANTYYLALDTGAIIRASASMDAAIQVSDVVYVSKSGSNWLITGTA